MAHPVRLWLRMHCLLLRRLLLLRCCRYVDERVREATPTPSPGSRMSGGQVAAVVLGSIMAASVLAVAAVYSYR